MAFCAKCESIAFGITIMLQRYFGLKRLWHKSKVCGIVIIIIILDI
jgi:hypothetical protein